MENETINTNMAEGPKVKNNKHMLIVGLVLLVVAAIAISLLNSNAANKSAVEGCRPGDKFSETSGEPCNDDAVAAIGEPCKEGDVYSVVTGEPCREE